MLDELIKLVQQNAGEAIVKNQAIPNQHNDAAIQEVAGQIFNGLKGQVAQGNMDQVVSMFQGGSSASLTNNPMVAQIISNVAGNFAAKFGISPDTAKNVVASLIPTVMSQLVKKTNDPNDSSFDLSSMVQSMGGNNTDLAGMLGKLGGGNTGDLGGALGGLFGKG
jgi:hypothetical protein